MTGKYDIRVYDSNISYHLEVKRNITILQGNSASGKSELVRMVSDYNRAGISSGVTIVCDKKCIVVGNSDNWKEILELQHDRIIFIDENNSFIKTKEFAEIVNKADNYFVLIYRDSLSQLSYSVEEIYGLRETRDTQKYHEAQKVYNEMYKIYNLEEYAPIKPELVITEDSNSGYDFYKKLFSCKCLSAGGKSMVTSVADENIKTYKSIVCIVDGAAFGADIAKFMRKTMHFKDKCILYAPESFEYLILKSGLIEVDSNCIDKTYDYADSKEYSSWEQFFTSYLISLTQDTVKKYSKNRLSQYYCSDVNISKIAEQLPELIEV